MRRHRRELKVLAEINLTNLVDTSFVLLIGFMLMAPAVKNGIKIEPPVVSSAPVLPTNSHTLSIVIQKSEGPGQPDKIYIENTRVAVDDIPKVISDKKAIYSNLDILIEGDTNSNLGTFAQVMGVLKKNHYDDVGFVTAPVDASKTNKTR